MAVTIRPATEEDQGAIRAMVRGERLNPTKLDWPNFLVAVGESGVVGIVQMRKHADGSRELGSLVVAKAARGQGITTRLVDALLAGDTGRVQVITDGAFATHYVRWGFRRIAPGAASRSVRLNYRIGRAAIVISLLKRLSFRRLVILNRAARVPFPAPVGRSFQRLPQPLELERRTSLHLARRVDIALQQGKTPGVREIAPMATDVVTLKAKAAPADRFRAPSKTAKTTG